MEKIQLLLEAYSSNKKQYTEDKYFKFLKKIYKVAKSTGALNIGFIYYALNNNSPKSMDLEFIKIYIDSLTPDNSTLVVMFTEYWNENMGMDLLDGLPMQFNLSIKEEEAFAALVANNDLEKVLKLLDITADRITSITSKCEEDMFYSKCLNDYERNEFKNAVAGLQFDIYDYLPELPKEEKEKREKIKKLKEEIADKNEQWKKEGKGLFERLGLKQKAWKEGYDKIMSGYNTKVNKMDSPKIEPISEDKVREYSKLNNEAFKAIKEAYKKYSKIKEWRVLERQAPDDEWGTWDNFVAGKLDTYSIALVSWDQEDWSDFGEELVDEANFILSEKGYGEYILSIGGDGDEGIIDINTSSAEINFDKLK